LEAKWVVPYVVVEKSRSGAYRLSDPQGKMLEHSWNTDSFGRFFCLNQACKKWMSPET
jgi:hypothetical protein